MTKVRKYKNKKTGQIVHVTNLLEAERVEFIDLGIVTIGSFTFTSDDWEEMRDILEFEDIGERPRFYCNRYGEVGHDGKYPPSLSSSSYPTEKLAIATEALRKLLWLRHEITEGREPDWNDGEGKYSITNSMGQLCEGVSRSQPYLLSFPTEEARDEFMKAYQDLLELALPLL